MDRIPKRRLFIFIFYVFIILFLLNRIMNHLLLSQLEEPVMKYVAGDFVYWLLFGMQLPQFLVETHWAGVFFDVLLFAVPVLCIVFSGNKWLPVLFSILLFIYIVVSYGYLNFHKHNLVGPLIFSFAFWAVSERGFQLSLSAMRVYTLFTYFSAGFWKLYRGLLDADGHFMPILKNDALSFLIHNPDSVLSSVIAWMINHPGFTDLLMHGNIVFQLSFVLGFFTRKLDWLFLFGALSFHILSLLLLRAFFLEFSIVLLTLLPLSWLYKSQPRVS